jgi:hypothetical protein
MTQKRHRSLHELFSTSVIDMDRLHTLLDLMTPQDAGRVRAAFEKALLASVRTQAEEVPRG